MVFYTSCSLVRMCNVWITVRLPWTVCSYVHFKFFSIYFSLFITLAFTFLLLFHTLPKLTYVNYIKLNDIQGMALFFSTKTFLLIHAFSLLSLYFDLKLRNLLPRNEGVISSLILHWFPLCFASCPLDKT